MKIFVILCVLILPINTTAHFANTERGLPGAIQMLQESAGMRQPPPGDIFVMRVKCSLGNFYSIDTTPAIFPSGQHIVITEVILEDGDFLTLYDTTRMAWYQFQGPHWTGERIFLPGDDPVGRLTSGTCVYGEEFRYIFLRGYYWTPD